jgi:type IV secretion system protein VirB11
MVGTGKTYDLRAFLEAIPMDWRIVTVEDMEEIINMAHPNVVNPLYPKGKDQDVSKHTAGDCIEAALRLDMDILVNQELRDSAAWAYLRALNSIYVRRPDLSARINPDRFRTAAE